MNREKEKVIYI